MRGGFARRPHTGNEVGGEIFGLCFFIFGSYPVMHISHAHSTKIPPPPHLVNRFVLVDWFRSSLPRDTKHEGKKIRNPNGYVQDKDVFWGGYKEVVQVQGTGSNLAMRFPNKRNT